MRTSSLVRRSSFVLAWLSLESVLLSATSLFALDGERHPGSDEADPLPGEAGIEASSEVTRAELHHHVAFLASDELRGRAAATPDAHRAARYLARALEAEGLEPGGNDGFLQHVPLERREHRDLPKLFVTQVDGTRAELVFGVDFNLSMRGQPDARRELRLVRVAGEDDLPEAVSRNEAIFLDGSSRKRKAWLAAMGGDPAGADWGLYVRAGSKKAGRTAAKPRGRLGRKRGEAAANAAQADPCDVVSLRGPWREALREGRIERIELALDVVASEAVDDNVVGVLPGVGTAERPELANEVIVFSAHYDHLGVREEGGGAHGDSHEGEDAGDGDEDHVYNGADDDASGVAAVLELAQAFARAEPPARTLVFLLAGGEERGLIGTRYYLEHPARPLSATVCNLNFEMIGRPDALSGGRGKLWLTGHERSNLAEAFTRNGLPISADMRPEQNFFRRSDNYAFAELGIVAQTLSSYDMHKDYHAPSDELETLDFEHLEQGTQAALAAARLLAYGTLDPRWLPGGDPTEE